MSRTIKNRIPPSAALAIKIPRMSIQAKFTAMRADMAAGLVERESEIDLILTAMIAQENPLLVGMPGTAKSLLVDTLIDWLGGVPKFSILFNKFSVPEDVFGPISVQGLKSDIYRRVTTNKLPEAVLGFGDEIFRASPAILNTLLRVINEHLFENGDGSYRKCPLRMFVAAANTWPQDEELGALFDRFLIRKTVSYVSPSGRAELFRKAVEHEPTRPVLTSSITVEEVDEAHEQAMKLGWAEDAKEAFGDLVAELNSAGIFPGDRRVYKAVGVVRAYAYLCGAAEVQKEHLEVLAHVLWDDPQQAVTCAKIVAKAANPISALVFDKLALAQDICDKHTASEAVPKLQAIEKELAEAANISNDVRVKRARATLQGMIKTVLNKSIGVVK